MELNFDVFSFNLGSTTVHVRNSLYETPFFFLGRINIMFGNSIDEVPRIPYVWAEVRN